MDKKCEEDIAENPSESQSAPSRLQIGVCLNKIQLQVTLDSISENQEFEQGAKESYRGSVRAAHRVPFLIQKVIGDECAARKS